MCVDRTAGDGWTAVESNKGFPLIKRDGFEGSHSAFTHDPRAIAAGENFNPGTLKNHSAKRPVRSKCLKSVMKFGLQCSAVKK